MSTPRNPNAIFIRHAESTGNAEHLVKGTENYPLDDKGKQESRALATRVARYKPTVVLSSPLDRAKVPAQLIAKKAGVKLKIDNGLLPPDLGNLAGTPQRTGEPRVREAFSHPGSPIGGTGSTPQGWLDEQKGTMRRIQLMIQKGERPAIVTHSRNLRVMPHTFQDRETVPDPTKGGPEPSGFATLSGNKFRLHAPVMAKETK